MSVHVPRMEAAKWRDWAGGKDPLVPLVPLPGLMLSHWSATSPLMAQPPLADHLIAIHLGGSKRVFRAGPERIDYGDVEVGDFSTVTAGHEYVWRTEGPIHFAHLFIEPERFAAGVSRIFTKARSDITLPDLLGRRDPMIPQLVRLMFAGVSEDEPLWTEQAFEYLLARVGDTMLTLGTPVSGRHPLPATRVMRVREFVRANLHRTVRLDELAEIAGVSPFHFIRAFRSATGFTPYAFTINERIAAAMGLLAAADLSMAEIGKRTGFGSPARFSSRFLAVAGLTPSQFRRRARSGADQKPFTSWTM